MHALKKAMLLVGRQKLAGCSCGITTHEKGWRKMWPKKA